MSLPSEGRLGEWLRGTLLDPGGAELEANRARVVAITGALGVTRVIDLLAYAYGRPGEAEPGFALLLSAVRESEEEWSAEPDSLLARRLAAAALADRLAGEDDGAVILALAVKSAAFGGYPPPLPDLPFLAEGALARIGAARRRRLPESEEGSLEEELKAAIKEITVPADAAVTAKDLRAILEKTRTALRALARRTDAAAAKVRARRMLVDEELDILWWSQGAASETLGAAWSDVGEETTLLAAIELAGRQRLQPPPRSAPGLLAATLRVADLDPRGPVTLRAAVEAVAGVAGERRPGEAVLPAWLLPVSAATEECRREGGVASWAPAYQAVSGVDPGRARTRLELAVQMLCERSLAVLIGGTPA